MVLSPPTASPPPPIHRHLVRPTPRRGHRPDRESQCRFCNGSESRRGRLDAGPVAGVSNGSGGCKGRGVLFMGLMQRVATVSGAGRGGGGDEREAIDKGAAVPRPRRQILDWGLLVIRCGGCKERSRRNVGREGNTAAAASSSPPLEASSGARRSRGSGGGRRCS